jgi:hypothetical protein
MRFQMATKQQIPFGDDNQKNNDNCKDNGNCNDHNDNPVRPLAEAEDRVGDVGFFEGGDLFGGEFDR